MTKSIKFGNILDAKGLIIQGVNCQGVMGSGVARDIRAKWPKVYDEYYHFVNSYTGTKSQLLGSVQLVMVESDVVVANLFSQEHFGKDGRKYISYEAIHKGFTQIADMFKHENGISLTSLVVNYPTLGAGFGGGEWSIISQIIDSAFEPYPTVERVLWIKE